MSEVPQTMKECDLAEIRVIKSAKLRKICYVYKIYNEYILKCTT